MDKSITLTESEAINKRVHCVLKPSPPYQMRLVVSTIGKCPALGATHVLAVNKCGTGEASAREAARRRKGWGCMRVIARQHNGTSSKGRRIVIFDPICSEGPFYERLSRRFDKLIYAWDPHCKLDGGHAGCSHALMDRQDEARACGTSPLESCIDFRLHDGSGSQEMRSCCCCERRAHLAEVTRAPEQAADVGVEEGIVRVAFHWVVLVVL